MLEGDFYLKSRNLEKAYLLFNGFQYDFFIPN